MKRPIPLILLFSVMLLAGSPAVANMEEGITPKWPIKTDLMAKNWNLPDNPLDLDVGDVSVWNTRDALDTQDVLNIKVVPGGNEYGPYKIKEVNVFVAKEEDDFLALLDKKGKLDPSLFPYKTDYLEDQGILAEEHSEALLIKDLDLDLCWGAPAKCPLDRYVIVHVELMMKTSATSDYVIAPEAAFAYLGSENIFLMNDKPIASYVTYPFAKVETGHFIDAKVKGLAFLTPTQSGTSSDSGNYFYIPGETIRFSAGPVALGSALADRTMSPIDLFAGSDLDDNRVINVARLLQTLDSNDHFAQIDISPNLPCLETAYASLKLEGIDFGNDGQVNDLLNALNSQCGLTIVSADVAKENLNQGQQAENILKGNISKNPAMAADKAKIEIMPFYIPAKAANGEDTTVVYHDEAGNVIETRDKAKPIVVTYEEEVEGTGARDIIVAISRDDGSTWKRNNISKTAGKSSFTTTTGEAIAGESNKPALNVKDNKIFVAWTDKYCHGGRPGYAIKNASDYNCDLNGDGTNDGIQRVSHEEVTECEADYTGDDAYRQEDLYGVSGNQRSVLYEDFPEIGEVPYSCVWTARGKIEADGNIVWFKPERITSGRRDANQLVSAAADDFGVAIAWQEDPKGLRPPEEFGPGDGWSGATVNKKTDIWYSFLKWSDFDVVDAAYMPPDNNDHVDTDSDLAGRAKALVPFSMPVKITDNDMCSQENILGIGGEGEDAPEDAVGTHRYCGTVENIGTVGNPGSNPLCAYTVALTNHNLETHNVCVTAGEEATRRVLDGNSGASRPNLFLQPYQKSDGTKTAAAILAYEESKGVGLPPENEGEHDLVSVVSVDEEDDDRYKPDLGKNVIYHSFPFDAPETVNGGFIINKPVTDDLGGIVYVKLEDGNDYLDPLDRKVPDYGNARRVRLLQQPKGKAVESTSKTILVALYREGAEGNGKPADIFMRRMTVGKELADGNPYSFDHFAGTVQNVSSVTPGEMRTYEVVDESTQNPTTITKMVNWSWSDANLLDNSEKEPYSNALAHRGALTGDELIIAYSWVPNWGRQAPEKYDLYVRRSWDGGKTFRNGSTPITHTMTYVDPVTKDLTETITTIPAGAPEPPRNVSNIRNNRISVLEPRLVKTPGNILTNDTYLYPEDKQNPSIYQVAWGMEVNELLNADGQPLGTPLDIYYGQTMDKGQNFETVVVTKQDGGGEPEQGWNLLAKDKPEQSGAQIKQTPDGSRMYAIWVENGEAGSDIMFRRIDYRQPTLP